MILGRGAAITMGGWWGGWGGGGGQLFKAIIIIKRPIKFVLLNIQQK